MLYLISVALLYPADRVSPLDDLDIAVISRRPWTSASGTPVISGPCQSSERYEVHANGEFSTLRAARQAMQALYCGKTLPVAARESPLPGLPKDVIVAACRPAALRTFTRGETRDYIRCAARNMELRVSDDLELTALANGLGAQAEYDGIDLDPQAAMAALEEMRRNHPSL